MTLSAKLLAVATAAAFLTTGCVSHSQATPAAQAAAELPKREKFLFWSPSEQIYGYRNIENIFSTHTVRRGSNIHPLPKSDALIQPTYTFGSEKGNVADYMTRNHVAGLLVIKDGKIVLEEYGLGQKPDDRWTSFSVGKSVTSTLVGAAIKDGYITSVDDLISKYIPELAGSAYGDVKISDVLKMRTGVAWNEDYEDPASDVGRLVSSMAHDEGASLVTLMRSLKKAAPAGSTWLYSTGESNMLGLLVMRATHKPLADYLSQKIWAPFGMEKDAVWMTDGGTEVGGCCISMTLKDYGRFGLFFLNEGKVGGKQVLPEGWQKAATTPYTSNVSDGVSYGYQWWLNSDGSFQASGIFGQSIRINVQENLVVVNSSAWPSSTWDEGGARQDAFYQAVLNAVHASH